MTQVLDIVRKSLVDIGAIAQGEPLTPDIGNDAFDTLNDMLDQWSNSPQMIFCQQEVIHELVASQIAYTIGSSGDVGCSFTGSIAGDLLTVSAVASGALSVGQVINGVLSGTTITSYGTATGGSSLGTYYINLSQTVGSRALTSSGVRPVRINAAFVRLFNSISGTLDYPVRILTAEQYSNVGIKTLPGPWPDSLYYQPSEPLGVIYYYPAPGQGELHLFCDTVLNRFSTLNDTVTLPQGYVMALRWNLAELLQPSFGKADPTQIGMIAEFARRGRAYIKRTNMQPAKVSQIDPRLMTSQVRDAGWILSGGFS